MWKLNVTMSNLMNEKPLMVLSKTATAIGLNDYESLERLEREIFEKEDNPLFKMSRPPVQNEQSNTREYTETTTEINNTLAKAMKRADFETIKKRA